MDLPPAYPPSSEQVIEQKLLDCGLKSGAFTVKYEDYLRSIEVVIGADAGADLEDFECIRAAVGHEIVTFQDDHLQIAYADQSYELVKPKMLADAAEGLRKRGLLDGFPERANFSSDKAFAEAIESHCGVEVGSFFAESEWGLIAKSTAGNGRLSASDWDKMTCLMNSLMHASAKGDGFKIGFIGNQKFRDDNDTGDDE